ncbi:hypothetical protein E2562_003724 [Oryza meyeriana var. granulata]|uniref:Uncharacterized protein n=1 Tax=Oryza meyeriana var. granulata TaxID=110450 RepID=A0A6G1C3T0_9ORYZ|nr:hypothetical protein E2562_003724 [Oryza meyeriana var. granulata]
MPASWGRSERSTGGSDTNSIAAGSDARNSRCVAEAEIPLPPARHWPLPPCACACASAASAVRLRRRHHRRVPALLPLWWGKSRAHRVVEAERATSEKLKVASESSVATTATGPEQSPGKPARKRAVVSGELGRARRD